MNNQELSSVEVLAAEYVLGTLTGNNLKRFKKLMNENPQVQKIVVEWQESLVPLNDQTPEIEPSTQILEELITNISPASDEKNNSWWKELTLWRPFAVGNLLLSFCLAGYIAFQLLQAPSEIPIQAASELETGDLIYVGVLEDTLNKPKVAVLAYNKPFRLVVKSKDELLAKQGNELRIWMIEKETDKIKFLTTMAAGQTQLELSNDTWKLMKTATQLIVSEDPINSNRKTLTGDILFKGVCINLKKWDAGS